MLSTLKQPNRFEYNLPALWLKPLKCGVCANEFVIKSKTVRRPLLMKCNHAVCDRCCVGPRPLLLTCSSCNEVTRVEKHQALREILETHYYLLGILSYKEFGLNYDVNFVNAHSPNEKRMSQGKSSLQECSECNDVLTNCFCIQCNVPYCKNCFESIHKHGKALQRHCMSQFDGRGKASIEFDEKRCKRHNNFIAKYCIDCKLALCVVCVMEAHGRHKISSLAVENQKSLSHVASLMETVKTAKEMNKQAQKDAKFISKRYEDFASEAVENISSYFIYLHGALQSIEREALFKVKDSALKLIDKIEQTQSVLKKGQETFEEVLSTLEESLSHPPTNFTITKLMEKTNSILESVPCNIEFDGANANPFEFIRMKKEPAQFPNLYELHIRTSDFQSRILTYFGDSSSLENSASDLSSSRVTDEPPTSVSHFNPILTSTHQPHPNPSLIPNTSKFQMKKGKKQNQRKNQPLFGKKFEEIPSDHSFSHSTNSGLSDAPFSLKNSTVHKVHVSHIKNPEHFYVQVQKFYTSLENFSQYIAQEAEFAPSPDYIDVSQVYLVFNAANRTWYRGEVLNMSSPDLYKVFLVDFGNTIQVPKQRFRTISETMKSKPNGAIHCSLYGIKGIKNEWSDNANQLMSEIIMNEMVQMIIYKEDTICQVDLVTTHLTYPTSVRNALIFANFATDDINLPFDMQKRVQQLSSVRKSLLTPPNAKYYKNVFKEGESFRGIILHVNDPHDFYAVKYDHKSAMDNLYEELNQDYQQPQQKLFTPLVNMPCVVYVDDKWHRAKITKITAQSQCTVWLVDRAQSHTVPYTQLRALQSKYLTMNECAFQCSLTDIEPHQKFGYMWTPNAIAEFKRIIQNPVLQIIVHRTQNFLHQICLYIIKKDLDVNVNALLVKYKHANSTGPESQYVEYPKLHELAKGDDDILNEINLMEMTLIDKKKSSTNNRTKVKILHIVSPGEFYLTKTENQVAISKFQEEIQLSRSKDDLAPMKPFENVIDEDGNETDSIWKTGNYCLARLRLKEESPLQWYRGVIKTILLEGIEANAKYTIFLRDYGKTFENISSENIAPIPGLFSRVCDGAIKCHMACIQPTGGLTAWSGASIDEFKAAAAKFQELAASIQGTRESDSIPVILWGLKQDCPDPLAPTVFKWVNLNKYLSVSGLAHLTDKFFPVTEQNALKTEPIEGEESFSQWLDHLGKTIDEGWNRDGRVSILQREDDSDLSEEETCIEPYESEEFTTWLPAQEITKTVFLGIPTFVDNEGVIYLYDAAKKQIFENIITVVNKVVRHTKQLPEDSFWYVGQPCLAQYSIDGKFYRAIVLETKPDRRVSVQFVDYGNVQECSTKDLRKQVTLTQIPIQVCKYKLDGILPLEGKTKLSLDALDFLYANTVNKECAIRVSANQQHEEVKYCSIKCGPVDLAELLVEAGFARKPRPSSSNSFFDVFIGKSKRVSQKGQQSKANTDEGNSLVSLVIKSKKSQDCNESDDEDDDDTSIGNFVKTNVSNTMSKDRSGKESKNYKALFEKIDIDNLDKLKYNSSKESSDDVNVGVIESTYKPTFSSQDPIQPCSVNDREEEEKVALIDQPAADTSLSSFDIKNTSTSTRKNKQASFEPFQIIQLPKSIKQFKGEVSYILDSITIAVYPILADHKKLMLELATDLQVAAALSPNLKFFEPNTPCLAMFSEDKMWYRAMIRSHNLDENTVDVVFVDFFNAEWVPERRVRICPSDLIKVPLRNVPVKLAGIKPNRRWRTSDIQSKFSELVEDRQVFIKIVSYEGETPIVELYENEDSSELLYESMITERFYLKN